MKYKNIIFGSIFIFLTLLAIGISNSFYFSKLILYGFCCLLLMIYICVFGYKKSLIIYGLNSLILLLSFHLSPTSLVYILLFGPYAFFKYFIEEKSFKLRDETLIKLSYFNLSLLLLYKPMNELLLNKSDVNLFVLSIILYNLVFIGIDYLLTCSLTYIERFAKDKLK